jgi:ribonucleoside-diphosphate reductase alpha chain
VRNSQVTVLAPTGTIAFMMDCDTTGVEPDIALVKYKKLVGGGLLKFVNQTVPTALKRLGYETAQIQNILEYIDEQETIEGADDLKSEHLEIFDCAFKPRKGVRSIEPSGHLRMMGAVQPFLSGAISKTVNMPHDATVEQIEGAYLDAWRLGLKAVAVYRDGCKRTQPLNTSKDPESSKPATGAASATTELGQAVRRRLPSDCVSYRHKFEIAGHEGYIHLGFYDDGTPGELFIKMAKEGSTISGLMDTIATLTSLSLQYGVPLEALVKKFEHVRFEPSGFTKNPDIPLAKSLTDYIFRFLGTRFGGKAYAPAVSAEHAETAGVALPDAKEDVEASTAAGGSSGTAADFILPEADAPSCTDCGSMMVRNGACYKCLNCGATSGCS